MKTVLLDGLKELPNVHFVDRITPQTFLSGQIPDPMNPSKVPASLLHRIGDEGVLVVPDFSTMLSGSSDKRGSIFSDMRRIYDGQLRKEFGTSEPEAEREWNGRLTIIVAVTPEIDRYSSVFQSLGERFVMVRWPRAGGIETALAAMNQDNKGAKQDLNAAVRGLMSALPQIDPIIPLERQIQIANMAELTVIARTAVSRSGYGNEEITDAPEPESATRFAQQIAQLAKGSALLDARETTNELGALSPGAQVPGALGCTMALELALAVALTDAHFMSGDNEDFHLIFHAENEKELLDVSYTYNQRGTLLLTGIHRLPTGWTVGLQSGEANLGKFIVVSDDRTGCIFNFDTADPFKSTAVAQQ